MIGLLWLFLVIIADGMLGLMSTYGFCLWIEHGKKAGKFLKDEINELTE